MLPAMLLLTSRLTDTTTDLKEVSMMVDEDTSMVAVGNISVGVIFLVLELFIVCVGCIALAVVCCVLDIFIMFDDITVISDVVLCERSEDLLLTKLDILLLSEIIDDLEVIVGTISVLVSKVASVAVERNIDI
mgnify:CR=1 FL=1